MEQREAAIRQWFDMWLTKQDTGIRDLFAPDAVYIESWGPEYRRGEDRLVVHRVESPGHGGAVGHPPVFPQGGPDRGGVDLRQPDG